MCWKSFSLVGLHLRAYCVPLKALVYCLFCVFSYSFLLQSCIRLYFCFLFPFISSYFSLKDSKQRLLDCSETLFSSISEPEIAKAVIQANMEVRESLSALALPRRLEVALELTSPEISAHVEVLLPANVKMENTKKKYPLVIQL